MESESPITGKSSSDFMAFDWNDQSVSNQFVTQRAISTGWRQLSQSVQVLIDVFIFLVGILQQVTLKNGIPLWFKMLRQGLQETIRICAISYRQIFSYLVSFSSENYLKSFQNDWFGFPIKFSCYLIALLTLSEKIPFLCQDPLETHWGWLW